MIRLLTGLFLLLLVSGFLGCSGLGGEVAWREPGADLVWPKPPETPKIRFLRALSADDRGQEEKRRLIRWLTGEESSAPLQAPYAVAADGRGKVWVTDGASRSVHSFDLNRGRVKSLTGAGEAGFEFPAGVAVDSFRKVLYVADAGLGKVFRFGLDDARPRGEVTPPAGFLRPGGVAVDGDGNLFVSDALRGTVEVFSPAGAHLRTQGSLISQDGRFRRPIALTLDQAGRLYVVDALNFRVEILSPEGKSLGTVGGLGDAPGSFARPRGVTVDSEGHIYVTDAAFDNVQVFDGTGRLLLVWGRSGKSPGEFCLPAGLTSDSQDRIYAVDTCNHRIQIFQYLSD